MTPALDTVIRGILGYEDFTLGGRFKRSSLVKTELNGLFIMSALS